MKFIIKLFPEIIMKSDSVRKRFIKVLANTIRDNLRAVDSTVTVVRLWDKIVVRSKDQTKKPYLIERLQCIPGIHHFLEVEEMTYINLHDIFEKTLAQVADEIVDKTFCVRVKRRGCHDFNSMDVMRYVGGGLNQRVSSAKVQLENPDVTVNLEIEDDKSLLTKARFDGLGGFPVSTQEDVLSLISGGFDSAVASFNFIRRGSRVHYVFFNLGGKTHEIGTKQTAYELWRKYSPVHKVKFITVNFEPVVAEILQKIDDGYMGVVLKRMMVRVASRLAKQYKINALVTGEAMGQVSSQTLANLQMIDKASDTLILRPLITNDKEEIIKMAKKIGTADIAKSMPEFCGVISKSPTVKAAEHKLVACEENFDFNILQTAIETALCIDIRQIQQQTTNQKNIQITSQIGKNDVILDIRSPDEIDDKPLVIENAQVATMPFYKLTSSFNTLDGSKTYLLYCTKGVMSKLQALYLMEQGFDNIKVFQKS